MPLPVGARGKRLRFEVAQSLACENSRAAENLKRARRDPAAAQRAELPEIAAERVVRIFPQLCFEPRGEIAR